MPSAAAGGPCEGTRELGAGGSCASDLLGRLLHHGVTGVHPVGGQALRRQQQGLLHEPLRALHLPGQPPHFCTQYSTQTVVEQQLFASPSDANCYPMRLQSISVLSPGLTSPIFCLPVKGFGKPDGPGFRLQRLHTRQYVDVSKKSGGSGLLTGAAFQEDSNGCDALRGLSVRQRN